MDAMKIKLVSSLIANLSRAIIRTVGSISGKAAQQISRSSGTSPIGNAATTGALCPDHKDGTVRKLRFPATLRSFFSFFLSLRGVKRRGNPVGNATNDRNPLDCRVGPLGLLAMTTANGQSENKGFRLRSALRTLLSALRTPRSALIIAGIATSSASLHAGEQDNWYLADEWSVSNSQNVAYEVNATTGKARIYVSRKHSTNKLAVYETNGTLVWEISVSAHPRGVAVDGNGTIYLATEYKVFAYDQDGNNLWNSIHSSYNNSSGNGQFRETHGIAISPAGELFVADHDNHRIQVLDRNGTFKRKFGSSGSDPGQFSYPHGIAFLPDGTLVVGDNNYLHFFQSDGTFIKRTSTGGWVSAAPDGTMFGAGRLRDPDGDEITDLSADIGGITAFTPEGDLIVSQSSKVQIWKRAYRTKGTPVRNVIPQTAIRGISQRAGTNVIDLDFEIIDPDDANATVALLAAIDGDFGDTAKWIVPTAWVDGTESKIDTPIATNQVHRVSWNVKGDWADQTGTLKFDFICHDARRTSPVDLHFLHLPLADGNVTISRSPLNDSDFKNYFKYLVATGQATLVGATTKTINSPTIETNSTNVRVFTNAFATGHEGPTWADANASYQGTNLEGNVTMTHQGIQEWTVPATGVYTIEAWGARGGTPKDESDSYRGLGARIKGDFSLVQGQVIKIAVGQEGIINVSGATNSHGGRGGGGSFVWIDGQSQPLLAAGGGGGASVNNNYYTTTFYRHGRYGTSDVNGLPSWSKEANFGVNGGDANSTGGAKGWNSMLAANDFSGDSGGQEGGKGGFGGGGRGADGDPHAGGGGGGYSGGGSGEYGVNSGSGDGGGRNGGGGGGSYNAGTNQENAVDVNAGQGRVFIAVGSQVRFAPSSLVMMNADGSSTALGREHLMKTMGYRFATPGEVTKARQAATPGSVNKWTAKRPVKPRNLPKKVNEYGFDTKYEGSHPDYWWVIREQE